MVQRLGTFVLLMALAGAAPALASPAQEAALARVIADFEAYERAEDPVTAGQEGDRNALGRWPEITPPRTFHDAVLLDGPLPLDVLEARIDRWITQQTAPPPAPKLN